MKSQWQKGKLIGRGSFGSVYYATLKDLMEGDIQQRTFNHIQQNESLHPSENARRKTHYGLYTSFVAPLVYAFMGSLRDIVIGPVAVVSLLLGTLLTDEFPNFKSHEYLRLVFTATFFAGITQMALGLLRLGFLIDFLSHAAIVGFMGGAAITIALQQLKVHSKVPDESHKHDPGNRFKCNPKLLLLMKHCLWIFFIFSLVCYKNGKEIYLMIPRINGVVGVVGFIPLGLNTCYCIM